MIPERQMEIVLQDQAKWFLRRDPGIPRSIDISRYLNHTHVVIISGVRRCGKSTLLRQIASHFDGYYYLNLDDERLFGFELSDFSTLMILFEKMRPGVRTIFLDEIQNVPGFERFIRRIHDEGYRIFCTGSNAHLLSKELGTHLTGRHVRIELFPFSFSEYLTWHKIDYNIKDSETIASLLSYLDRYLEGGGFPEYTRQADPDILKGIYEDILYRDSIVRWNIRDTSAFINLARYLLTNIGSEVSYRSLATTLQIKSPGTVREYIRFLADTYLFFEVYRYDPSLKKQHGSGKKIYCIDNGMRNKVSFRFSADNGKLLENIVFLELLRRKCDVYYHSAKKECDLITLEQGRVSGLYQVCYELNEGNQSRECSGLQEAMVEYSIPVGTIITMNQSEEIPVPEGMIRAIPVWRWVL